MMRVDYEDVTGGGAVRAKVGPQRSGSPKRLTLAGVPVENVTGKAMIRRLRAGLANREHVRVAFLNAHCVNILRATPAYRDALRDCIVLADGVGVDLGAMVLHGRRFVENLNGTDFVPRLFRTIQKPLKVGLVGGAPGVAERAAGALATIGPAHHYVAVSDGYFGEEGRSAVLSRLEDGRFDIVLVAMGVPTQEIFLTRHLDERHGRIQIGVGALLDFLAGDVVRAPATIRLFRLEWVWRLFVEPGRLWRRYVIGNPLFVAGILRDRFFPRSRD